MEMLPPSLVARMRPQEKEMHIQSLKKERKIRSDIPSVSNRCAEEITRVDLPPHIEQRAPVLPENSLPHTMGSNTRADDDRSTNLLP